MRLTIKQADTAPVRLWFGKAEEESKYCKGPCVCGQDCHKSPKTHKRITGALTTDEYSDETPCILPTDIDEELFAFAMATLSGGK